MAAVVTILLISTNPKIKADQAFRLITRLQQAASSEKTREQIRSGMPYGCARIKSGPFEFEYSVMPGQLRVAYRRADDEMDSCKLLR